MQNWILIALLFKCFFSLSQADTLDVNEGYSNIKLHKHQIKALYGFLKQDGSHSAVTGGEGTEELQVHSARVVYVKKAPQNNQWKIKAGLDNITSASTDKIDFYESSASKHDFRAQINIGLNHSDSLDTNFYGININGSLESDYLSRGIGAHFNRKNKYGGFTSVKGSFYWDELRWGLITSEIFDFTEMVYPMELRDTSWFDISHRNTFTLGLNHSFITSLRSKLGLMLDITYQTGILSTPFHRTYFSNGSLRVERLPFERLRLPLAVQYNYFFGSGFIMKNYFRYSWDSFGVKGYTYRLETPFKVNYWVWIKPYLRLYSQTAALYFKPYKAHDVSSDFYTSDYDLSSFWALNYGLGFKFKKRPNWQHLKGLEWVFENYKRADGLNFWQTSFMIDFSF